MPGAVGTYDKNTAPANATQGPVCPRFPAELVTFARKVLAMVVPASHVTPGTILSPVRGCTFARNLPLDLSGPIYCPSPVSASFPFASSP